MALTVVLLAASGASLRAFLVLYETPFGYDPSHLLTVALHFPDGTHTKLKERHEFYADVRRKVTEVPGVKLAALYSIGFPPWAHFMRRLELFDQPAAKDLSVTVNSVSPEFFATLKIPLLEGASWSEQETARAAHVALVNEAFARRAWPDGKVLGRKLRLPDYTAFTTWRRAYPGSNDWLTIVGVVGNTPNDGLGKPSVPAVYLPYSLLMGDSFVLAVRTEGNPLALTRSIRQAVQAVDAGQPVNQTATAEDILSDEGWATQKFVASLFALFSGLALLLASIGLYSVV